MWYKIIIVGMVKKAGHYYIFSSEDNKDTKIEDKELANKQEAEAEAARHVGKLKQTVAFVEDSIRKLVFEVPQKDRSSDEELEKLLAETIEPYMASRFIALVEDSYWAHAVETALAPKKYELGFQVFLHDLESRSQVWINFRNEHSDKNDVVMRGLRKCFEGHYRKHEARMAEAVTV